MTRLAIVVAAAHDNPLRPVAEINEILGTNTKIETPCSLPTGGDCCRRRIWMG